MLQLKLCGKMSPKKKKKLNHLYKYTDYSAIHMAELCMAQSTADLKTLEVLHLHFITVSLRLTHRLEHSFLVVFVSGSLEIQRNICS